MKTYLSALLIATLLFTSCKKSTVKPAPVPVPSEIAIEGKLYPVVKIGSLAWTAMNHSGPGGEPYNAGGTKPELGRYYTFDEVRGIPLPSGWRIATTEDYRKLLAEMNINASSPEVERVKKLTSITNWNNLPGTNSSGFNAHPGGYMFNGSAAIYGDNAEFWTAESRSFSIRESGLATKYIITFYANGNGPGAVYRFNVRFVRDVN